MTHFVEDGRNGAGGRASDLLLASGAADDSFAFTAEVAGIEVEVDVVGLGGERDELDVGKRVVELPDGGGEIGEIAGARGDDVWNLILVADFGPEVLRVVDAEGRQRALRIDGFHFFEDDVALKDGFAVLHDVGDRHAAVKSLAYLLCVREWSDGEEEKDGAQQSAGAAQSLVGHRETSGGELRVFRGGRCQFGPKTKRMSSFRIFIATEDASSCKLPTLQELAHRVCVLCFGESTYY